MPMQAYAYLNFLYRTRFLWNSYTLLEKSNNGKFIQNI
jgi:hypothetical protein